MCGRYTVLTDDEIIEVREIMQEVSLCIVHENLDILDDAGDAVYPTNRAPVITSPGNSNEVIFESAVFGFEKWDGKGIIINARSETVHETPMFKKHINTGRCVIPAAGYFEWQKNTKSKKKIKHLIKDKDEKLLFMAGLWRTGKNSREFVIITKEPTRHIADIHDRMPVMLRINQLDDWLSGKMKIETLAKLAFECIGEPCGDGHDEEYEQLSLE